MTNDDPSGATTIDGEPSAAGAATAEAGAAATAAGEAGAAGGATAGSTAAFPPPTARHRMWRSTDRILSGTAAGLASAFGVDAAWTRLAFVVLTLFRGVGVWAYGLAACLLPAGPFAGPPSRRRQVGAVVCGVALALVLWDGLETPYGNRLAFPAGPIGLIGSPAGLVLLLAGAAVVLWRRDQPRTSGAQPAYPGDHRAGDHRAGDHRAGDHRAPVAGAAGGPGLPPPGSGVGERFATTFPDAAVPVTPPAPAAVRAPRVRRPPSIIGRVALATAVAAVAGALIGGARPSGLRLASAVAAMACGLGLVAGAFGRRARYLVVPAALALATSVVASATAWAGTSFGLAGSYRQYGLFSSNDRGGLEMPPAVDQRAGDVVLVFGRPPFPSTVTVRLGRGNVSVFVPDDGTARVTVQATVGLGSIAAEGYRTTSGWHLSQASAAGPESVETVVHVDATVGVGRVSVHRYPISKGPLPSQSVEGFPTIPTTPAPDGSDVVGPDGSRQYPDGRIVAPDGTVRYPDGSLVMPNGEVTLTDGTSIGADGTISLAPGAQVTPDGTTITAGGAQINRDGSVWLPIEGPQGRFVIPSRRSTTPATSPTITQAMPANGPTTTAAPGTAASANAPVAAPAAAPTTAPTTAPTGA